MAYLKNSRKKTSIGLIVIGLIISNQSFGDFKNIRLKRISPLKPKKQAKQRKQ